MECRICLESALPLFTLPCKCRGTLRSVHKECFSKWMISAPLPKCEVCNELFHIDPKLSVPNFLFFDTFLAGLLFCYVMIMFVIVNSTVWCGEHEYLLFWSVEAILSCVIGSGLWQVTHLLVYLYRGWGDRDAFEKYIVDVNNKEAL